MLDGIYQSVGTGPSVQVNESWGYGMEGIEVQDVGNTSPSSFNVRVHEMGWNSNGPDIEVNYEVQVYDEYYGGSSNSNVTNHNQEPFDINVNGIDLRIDPNQFSDKCNAGPDMEFGRRSDGQFTPTGGGVSGDGTVEGSESWVGTRPELLFNARGNGYVGDQENGVYDRAHPGTDGGSNTHGTNGPDSVNIDAPPITSEVTGVCKLGLITISTNMNSVLQTLPSTGWI